MIDSKPLYFKNRSDWRGWLSKNYDKKEEIWLLYYKKRTGKSTIPYEDAVEEALCFGWIDGQVRSIDEQSYMQRYTPRRSDSVWSELNLNRIKKLIKEGRMTKVGLEKAKDILSGKIKAEPGAIPEASMPKDLTAELKKDKVAWENFENFPPSTKKTFYFWIISAKQEATKERRIAKTIKAAKDNNKFGYM